MPTSQVTLSKAARRLSPERCEVSPGVLAALNIDGALDEALVALEAGHGFQIRVRRDAGRYALYTVVGTRPSAEAGVVWMSAAGLARIDAAPGRLPISAEADMQVVDRPPRAEFTEHLTGFGAGADLVAIAPHGGRIEEHTDAQAERVVAELSAAEPSGLRGARCWACKGFRAGGGAAERWHITSADISEHSFPLLGTITAPPLAAFTYAVSFHGFRPGGPGEGGIPPGTEIWIGGRASGKNAVGVSRTQELRLLQARIRDALREDADDPRVRIAPPGGGLGGGDPRNVVNRLSTCGLQIEQTPAARQSDPRAADFIGFGHDRIARVVAEVYAAALRDGLVDLCSGQQVADPVR
jgi:phage replication-related protein YjqB (UPF0714/DUF867 family)